VYYQDAPTSAPIGNPPDDVIADHAVDLALLNVGNYDAVRAQPTEILATLEPRIAISGHWEDFFQPLSSPPTALPFEDIATYEARAEASLPGPASPPILLDGVPSTARSIIPARGTRVVLPPR
jgi:hypothetical protein